MLLVDLLGWWYSRGWGWALSRIFVQQSLVILHFFSITDLLKTLFAPFRQDSLSVKGAPISVRLQAFGGNIISRIFGFIIRLLLIVVGVAALVGNACIGVIAAILWPMLPLAPVLAVILMVQGMRV